MARIQVRKQEEEKWNHKLSLNKPNYCCLPFSTITKLCKIHFDEFHAMKKTYIQLVKNNLITSGDMMFNLYTFKPTHKMNTLLINQELEKFVNIEFMLIEGFKTHLLFINVLFNDNFKFLAGFDEKPMSVTIHTMTNLIYNHLSENKLPLYFNLKKPTESKFVKTFIKLCESEFCYNVIKSRLNHLIKHKCKTYFRLSNISSTEECGNDKCLITICPSDNN